MAVVLVIDDDQDTCEMMIRFLARAGHSGICASNGREAIMALTQHDPDVLLLDLTMPEMDGISFLQVIRSYLRWGKLPVFLITGVDDSSVLERASELGVKHVFRKSEFKLDDLVHAINQTVNAAQHK